MWKRGNAGIGKCAILAVVSLLVGAAAQGATNRLAIGFAEYSLCSNRLEIADIADPAAPLPVCHFDLGELEAESFSATNGVLRVEGAEGFAEFDISDIFAPVLASEEPTATVTNVNGLVLVACQTNGVQICMPSEDGPPIPATHCLTDGPALAVAPFPGGFAVALGTRGYALYELDESGLVTLRRQWPLEAGCAVSATYDSEAGEVAFDCQEGGTRSVAASPDSQAQPRVSEQ